MKTTTKVLLSLSFIFIGLGAIGLLWGERAGGLEDIQKATAPTSIRKDISSFKDLELDLASRDVIIQPSEDQNWHLSYYDDDKILGKLDITQSGDSLSLKQDSKETIVTGIISIMGFYLNSQTKDYADIVISVPKDTTLDNLTGFSGRSVELYALKLDNIDLTADYVTTDDVHIAKGKVSPRTLHLTNSSADKLNITDYDYLSMINSNLKNSQLETNYGDFDMDKGLLQNVSMKHDDSDLSLKNGELDNVSLSGEYNNLSSSNLRLKNLIDISNAYSAIDINLAKEGRGSTNFNLKVTDSELTVSDDLSESTQITSTDQNTVHQFTKQVKNNTATLTISNKEGEITVK
ncbi:DUF4097 family beta strand repeat-containing protein [Streptococcus pluranimalium]